MCDATTVRVTTAVGGTTFTIAPNFRLLKVLGSGAYGIVALAEDTSTPTPYARVAVKKIGCAYADLIDAKRVLREIKLMRCLTSHENLVELYDLDACADDITIFTRACETDLHRIIYSKQRLSDEHSKYFLYQILRGLKMLHSAGVLHRDLKPSNIFLQSNCDLRIGDLGLARTATETTRLTEYVVTRWYRAPEIMLSAPYAASSDVWSVGCIFGEILKRRPLFAGSDYLDQLRLILDVLGSPPATSITHVTSDRARAFLAKQPQSPRVAWATLLPRATPDALDLLDRMLAFDPVRRISVEDALAHPYLRALHVSEDEPSMSAAARATLAASLAFEAAPDFKHDKALIQSLVFAEVAAFKADRAQRRADAARAAAAAQAMVMSPPPPNSPPPPLPQPPTPPLASAAVGACSGSSSESAHGGAAAAAVARHPDAAAVTRRPHAATTAAAAAAAAAADDHRPNATASSSKPAPATVEKQQAPADKQNDKSTASSVVPSTAPANEPAEPPAAAVSHGGGGFRTLFGLFPSCA